MPLSINQHQKTTQLHNFLQVLLSNKINVLQINYQDKEHLEDEPFSQQLTIVQDLIDQHPERNFFIRNDQFIGSIDVYTDNEIINQDTTNNNIPDNLQLKKDISLNILTEISQMYIKKSNNITDIYLFNQTLQPYCKKLNNQYYKYNYNAYDFFTKLLDDIFVHIHYPKRTICIYANEKRPILKNILTESNKAD